MRANVSAERRAWQEHIDGIGLQAPRGAVHVFLDVTWSADYRDAVDEIFSDSFSMAALRNVELGTTMPQGDG